MKKYYTYAYLREDKTPYYIGKGTGNRAYCRARRERIKRPKDRNRILILKQFDNEADAFKHECYMIAVLGRKSEGGILHNITSGGEGTSFPKSAEHKRKIGEAHRGRHFSDKTRARMSESAKKKVLSPEHKAKLDKCRKAKKGKPWPAARRAAYEARWGQK